MKFQSKVEFVSGRWWEYALGPDGAITGSRPLSGDQVRLFVKGALPELAGQMVTLLNWERAIEVYGMARIRLAWERWADYTEALEHGRAPAREEYLTVEDEGILNLLEVK